MVMLVAGLSLTAIGLPAAAQAATAPNDSFASATVISGNPFTTTEDTSQATWDPSDPSDCQNNGSVWFTFTPSTDMELSADTFGSDYDTVLSAWTGTQGALNLVSCNDDFNGQAQSKITFAATAGTTYYFMAALCCGTGADGGGNLQFTVRQHTPAPNDSFASATVISGLPFTTTEDTSRATWDAGDPSGCSSNGSVWFSFTPSSDITLSADTSGSDYVTALSAWTGTPGSLNLLSCNDNFNGERSKINIALTGGTTYYFMVARCCGTGGEGGGILQFSVNQLTSPGNDNFASATPVGSLLFWDTQDLSTATVQQGEPSSGCFHTTNTVWYSFTPATTQSVTTMADHSTVGIAVYTGSSLTSLSPVECTQDPLFHRLTFRAQAGTTYYFQVAAWCCNGFGPTTFILEVSPQPVAQFYWTPSDPNSLDTIQFTDNSYDPVRAGLSWAWDFGDGSTSTLENPTHQYAADGTYPVHLTVTTPDGRTASTSRSVQIRTHDVAITEVSVPKAAHAGQTIEVNVFVQNTHYPETVRVDLFNLPAGFVGSVTQSVPVKLPGQRTGFTFSYTITSGDQALGKISFRADAIIIEERDARPADNELLSAPVSMSVSGAQLWVRRYNGGSGDDAAAKVAVSPSGDTVYVTGYSRGTTSGDDYATAAYSAATGARLWVARYNGPANGDDHAASVTVSPDGARVYVTGTSRGAANTDAATIAYSAATGARLWVARYNSYGYGSASSMGISPDGARVYITGTSQISPHGGSGYGTVAYNAATGARLWAALWGGSTGDHNYPTGLAVSPNGKKVYVTGGEGEASSTAGDYGTVAYSAATGTQLWARRYNDPKDGGDSAAALAVSPDGARVYVTGTSRAAPTTVAATIAYSAATGGRLWVARYSDPATDHEASSLAVSPDGKRVFVTGASKPVADPGTKYDYATIAYNATGTRLWVKLYNGPGNRDDRASSVTAPDNGKVYVTGSAYDGSVTRHDYATIAYDVLTGARLWVKLYNGPGSGNDEATSVTARAGRVFVIGDSPGTTSGRDYATVAYND
jgi:DNA-binding beta-propeller fold protein YncE